MVAESTSQPNYSRTYTHPSVLEGIAAGQGWADPTMDPTRIDWTARQRDALIPFAVVNGRPVNPCQQTGIRYGRNELGHWGEMVAADVLVSATDQHGHRWIVMVEREDGHGWALPGGCADPGEDPVDTGRRELREETGLDLARVQVRSWRMHHPRYVPDPRASDEAWMVTVLIEADLGMHPTVPDMPAVIGADDAKQAEWVPATDYACLTRHLAEVYDGTVFAAHVAMLADVLG